MTDERLPLAELLQKAGGDDFLRSVAEAVLQLLMEADVEGVIGAGRHERTAERATYRNGYRERALDTRLGTLQLRIPKLRAGPSYFPPFLEPRKTSEKALVAVIPSKRPSAFRPSGRISFGDGGKWRFGRATRPRNRLRGFALRDGSLRDGTR